MVLVALSAAAAVAVVAAAAGFAADGAGFAMVNVSSAVAAFVAVVAPQMFVVSAFAAKGGADGRRVFMLWAAKFSLILLLMASAARGLNALEMLVAPGFVFGVAAGICFNIVMAARMTLQFASYNSRV